MKNRLSLLLSSFLLVFSSVGAEKNAAELECFKSTPLSLEGASTLMEVTGKGISSKSLLVHVYIVNDLYPDGVEIANLTFKSSKTESILYNNDYTRTSNKIKITWKQSRTASENSATFKIGVAQGETVRLNSSIYTYESKVEIVSYVPGEEVKRSKQKLTFYNFEDKYMPNFYHKIDLSSFKIKNETNFPNEINCESALFSITNANNAFPKFNTALRIQLPVKLVNLNDELSLTFENKLYVNPITLEMSPKSDPGFVETKYFYLPRASKQTEESYECIIRINCLGIDNNDFTVSFRYKSLLNTFGDCRNSQYCIVNS